MEAATQAGHIKPISRAITRTQDERESKFPLEYLLQD